MITLVERCAVVCAGIGLWKTALRMYWQNDMRVYMRVLARVSIWLHLQRHSIILACRFGNIRVQLSFEAKLCLTARRALHLHPSKTLYACVFGVMSTEYTVTSPSTSSPRRNETFNSSLHGNKLSRSSSLHGVSPASWPGSGLHHQTCSVLQSGITPIYTCRVHMPDKSGEITVE
jgi:hypothetical protein